MLTWIFFVLIMGKTIVGWTSIMASIWLIGGVILIGIGIIGEYIGKIYIEVKNRPRFNVKDILMHENTKKLKNNEHILWR